MRTREKFVLGIGGLAALWIGWGAYVARKTERVPFETLAEFDGVEIRQYHRAILAETTAPDQRTAFRRLFGYIIGANEAAEELAMTAPVATRGESLSMTVPVRMVDVRGEAVSTTAPVRSERNGEGVTMSFYLPADATLETAPTPTDPEVRLVLEPPRIVAVRRFSWYATERRVDAERERLLEQLAERGIDVRGLPVLLQYDAPWTPPFMRTNEVEVAIGESGVEA